MDEVESGRQDGHQSASEKGARLAKLLFGSQTWVHRRVEAIILGAEGDTTRKVSLDVTIPSEWGVYGSKGRVVVPLALIEKGPPLHRLSTIGPSGDLMPVLGKADRRDYAVSLLLEVAPDWLRQGENRDTCEKLLRNMMDPGPDPREPAVDAFSAWADDVLAEEPGLAEADRVYHTVFKSLATQLASHFLLLVEVDRTLLDQRIILKFTHDIRIQARPPKGGAATAGFGYTMPDFGFAVSEHLELVLPVGVVVDEVVLLELDHQGSPLAVVRHSSGRDSHVGHEAYTTSTRFSRGEVGVSAVPARRGIYSFTRTALVAVTMAVLFAMAVKLHFISPVDMADKVIPSPSASILLIGPALLLSWLARRPEHDLTSILLRPLRKMLTLLSLVLLLMAVGAAIPLTNFFWNLLWVAACGLDLFVIAWFLRFSLDVGRASKMIPVTYGPVAND